MIISYNLFSTDNDQLPSSSELERYTPEQDSAYYRALRDDMPNFLLIERALIIDKILNARQNLSGMSRAELINKNISSIPDKYFMPSDVERVQHEESIYEALEVPFISTLPRYGTKIPMGKILTMMGLMEDVSPEIKYRLDSKADVEIVIYSINAAVIATIYSGKQLSGQYIRTWNLRDDMGRLMPSGDYIAEVRIGNERFVRKRIKIP